MSLEELIKKKTKETEEAAKPVFMSREEREKLALERRAKEAEEIRKKQEEERKKRELMMQELREGKNKSSDRRRRSRSRSVSRSRSRSRSGSSSRKSVPFAKEGSPLFLIEPEVSIEDMNDEKVKRSEQQAIRVSLLLHNN